MIEKYWSVADLARLFGVQPDTVTKWRQRYPTFPAPDVRVGKADGWHPDREQEIRDWHTDVHKGK